MNWLNVPISKIISTIGVHTENNNIFIVLLLQISLKGFVGTIGITDNNLETLPNYIVDAFLNLLGKRFDFS